MDGLFIQQVKRINRGVIDFLKAAAGQRRARRAPHLLPRQFIDAQDSGTIAPDPLHFFHRDRHKRFDYSRGTTYAPPIDQSTFFNTQSSIHNLQYTERT